MLNKKYLFGNWFKYINVLLASLCICPLAIDKKPWKIESLFYTIYYLSTWITHETLFLYTFTLKFNHKIHTKFSNTATLISWIAMARSFAVIVLISCLNLNNQKKLFRKIDELDRNLELKLNVVPVYKSVTIELIFMSFVVISFHYCAYISEGIYYKDDWVTMLFYFTCNHADIYFGLYVVYIAFWGNIYKLRLQNIVHALDALSMMTFISRKTLQRTLKILKLILDVKELIANSFGSIMFFVVMLYSVTIAVAVYVCLYTCYMHDKNVWTDLFLYSIWLLPLSLKLWYLVHTYNYSGLLVSD